ncbi:MAG: hypothetical protein RML46_11065 [Anaerolineae bacterium]|nr:hypothetical protein [Anaerolineae bacterium]MDW8069442.1 hypothetical protein [Anaerolineae bacterium]
MDPQSPFYAVLMVLALMMTACSPAQPGEPSRPTSAPPSEVKPGASSHSGWLSAREAVQQAYAALNTDWKAKATLVFVARYSRYAGEECSPLWWKTTKGSAATVGWSTGW